MYNVCTKWYDESNNAHKGCANLVHYLKLKKIGFIKNWHADRKHNVEKYEAESVFWNDPLYRRSREERGQTRYLALGETDEGRLLIVVYEIITVNEILIITAREMESEERRQYDKRRC